MSCPCDVGFHVDVQLTAASGLTDGTKLCLHPGVTTEFPSGYVNYDFFFVLPCAHVGFFFVLVCQAAERAEKVLDV
jgi:hypothetical protein